MSVANERHCHQSLEQRTQSETANQQDKGGQLSGVYERVSERKRERERERAKGEYDKQ